MTRNILLLVLVLGVGAAYTYLTDFHGRPVAGAAPASVMKEATSLQPLPEFSFTDLQGRTHSVSEYRGKALILNFWASWCAPCVKEFPQMLRLAEMEADKLVIVFLSSDENKNDIERFIKRHITQDIPANAIVALDEGKSITQTLFQTYKLPESYLVTAEGYIREKIIGADVVWDGADMREKVRALHTTP